MSDSFMAGLKNEAEKLQPNVSVTENGAIGYKTTGKALLDLNFMLSSMRNMKEDEIWSRFLAAYNEDARLAMFWLFFARDILKGCGERRTFRLIMLRLAKENPEMVVKVLPLIPKYGRWDDVIDLWDRTDVPAVKKCAETMFALQLRVDLNNMKQKKPISLLGKWLPSENTSSHATVGTARRVREARGMTPAQYRQMLSAIRAYLKVVECDMSANRWDQIAYSAVPSKAAMVYRDAFERHDGERYAEFIESVRSGKETINAKALYPYEIVHAYGKRGPVDGTLEAQWKALPNTVKEGASTLVVVDGSYSMETPVGHTGVRCCDVANSLGIYFAEKLTGPFKDAFITFSSRPELIQFAPHLTLRGKLDVLYDHDDCSNTDIAKVFGLLLDTAVNHHLKQSEIPANLLIISDGEFDDMTCNYSHERVSQSLFDQIRARWDAAGYKLPRLVFWNVCSRTGTIPVKENELGVALVSGFSPNIADMVMSGELDPYKCLLAQLLSGRYEPVEEALKLD